MKYECECCGNEIEKTLVCSQSCRMKLRRGNVIKHNIKPLNVKKDNKDVIKDNTLDHLVKKTEKKLQEIRYDNPFEMCKKHDVYKRSCGCK